MNRTLARELLILLAFLAGGLLLVYAILHGVSIPKAHAMATPELSTSGTPESQNAILIGYFVDASARFKAIVENPIGRTQGSRDFKLSRAAVLGRQADSILQTLRKNTASWVGSDDTFKQSVHDGRARADRQAVDAGVRVESMLPASFDVIDVRTAAVFARDAMADLDKAAGSMADRTKRILRATAENGLSQADINKILAGGVIDGTPQAAIRSLRDELEAINGGTIKIKTKNGGDMEIDTRRYAEMVVRTKTREAVQVARHERLESLGLDLVAVIGRVSQYFCTSFLGQVFSLSGKSDKYPAYASLPGGGAPFHPNCSKSTRPYVEALAGDQQKRDAIVLPDAKKLLGVDPAEAQRRFKDFQLHAQVKERYADTEEKLFGKAA